MNSIPGELTTEMLESCQNIIGYYFHDISLLAKTLTHASLRDQKGDCNERLEFLGDAILGMVVSEYLYRTFRDFDEGDLSLIKSEVVSRATLARIAKNLKLHQCFACSKGIQRTKKNFSTSVLANIVEAIIGAMYLDGTLDCVEQFIVDNFRKEIEEVIRNPHKKNYKSLLQFLAQKYMGITPVYKILHIDGPNHTRIFTACAVLSKRKFLANKGNNKKEAEQMAAFSAIQILALENPEIGEYVQTILFTDNQETEQLRDNPVLFCNSKLLLEHVAAKYALPRPQYYKTSHWINKNQIWSVAVCIGSRTFPKFTGEERKETERLAARKALQVLSEEYFARSGIVAPLSNAINEASPLWHRLNIQFSNFRKEKV